MRRKEPLTTSSEWTFDLINQYYDVLARMADDYGLDYYPNQIEIIDSEQMLDAYSSIGMPLFYNHWSFGQSFIQQQKMYQKGYMGLAYEIVINSNPAIAYLMEENSMLMQILVIAHASFGHNAFFKNNYLFKQWTDAESIIDYLSFAKWYIADCEERYGLDAVEEILDACHAIQQYGVDKYKRPPALSAAQEKARQKERQDYQQSQVNELWSTIPKSSKDDSDEEERTFPSEPQENLLYFIEKNAPNMEPWKREILRIVRKIAQYFYPQMQTKVMNEGFATFWHYTLLNDLYDEGYIDEGFMQEFLITHTNVVNQRGWHEGYNGINPYALGFAMFQDIKRICTEPTDEDRDWFPDFAGNGDWVGTIIWAMENFKDESFISQFLSPKVIRDFRFFAVMDDEKDPKYEISAIHDKAGYKHIRKALSLQYNIATMIPDIQVVNVDRWGDRSITLRHTMINNRPLDGESALQVMEHIGYLWGYDVHLESLDDQEKIRANYSMTEGQSLLDVFMDDDEG